MTDPAPVQSPVDPPLRVLLIDDSALFRHGLAALLEAGGLEIVAQYPNADDLPAVVRLHTPHVVVLDARMPPSHTDEGIQAALQIRRECPGVGVLVLSTYAEGTWASQLFAAGTAGIGYLLKDRVDDARALIDAIHRVRAGGTVIDAEVIERLVAVTNSRSPLDQLSPRERDVLSLMAQGRSNVGIGKELHVSPRTVEAYIAAIFNKLPLSADDSFSNRRVLAVLSYLQQRTAL